MIEAKKRQAKTKKFAIYRQERSRREVYGMMIQFDGSYHKRFETRAEECCLLLAVDDATGDIMHAMFCENESFECVSRFWIQYIIKFWVPQTIYLDKFSSYKVNHPKAILDPKMITNFQRIMRSLSCELIFANTPQAKWRVERMNQTLQDRLIKEMRLLGISDIVTWNLYLQNTYIQAFNSQFSVTPHKEWNSHTLLKHTKKELEIIFSKIETRKLWNDYVIQYKNKYYQILEGDYTIYPKKVIDVHETYDHKIYLKIWTKFINHLEADTKSVRVQRLQHQWEIRKFKNEKKKIEMENRQQARNDISKKNQYHQKALKLLSKLEQKMI